MFRLHSDSSEDNVLRRLLKITLLNAVFVFVMVMTFKMKVTELGIAVTIVYIVQLVRNFKEWNQ